MHFFAVVKHCIERLVCYTLIAFVVIIAVCAASNWIIREICWNVHTGYILVYYFLLYKFQDLVKV